MSSNITGCQELSCDDSPLSMTGSIIGILTFAYAIAITAIFYANAFLSAETERGQFQSRLKSEVQSLELVLDLLRNYAPMVPDTDAFARKIEPWLVQAARSIQEVQPRVILVPGGGDDEKSRRWRFLNRARFVGDKEQLSKDFADIAAKRTQLEGVYQGVMTSIVVMEIQKQSDLLRGIVRMHQEQQIRSHNMMQALENNTQIQHAMGSDFAMMNRALHETGHGRGVGPLTARAFDILNDHLRPDTEGDSSSREEDGDRA